MSSAPWSAESDDGKKLRGGGIGIQHASGLVGLDCAELGGQLRPQREDAQCVWHALAGYLAERDPI